MSNKNKALSCVQSNALNNARKETDFVGPLPVNQSCDTSSVSQDEINQIQNAYQKQVDDYKAAVKQYEEDKKKFEDEQRKAQEEANKCNNSWNIFDSKNCVNKGFMDALNSAKSFGEGFVDGLKAIPTAIAGAWDRLSDIPTHFTNPDKAKYTWEDIVINGALAMISAGATLAAVAVVIVGIIAAPFTGGASLVGASAIAGTLITIAGTAGIISLAGNLLLDNSDKPKFIDPTKSSNPQDYLNNLIKNAKTKGLGLACGEKGGNLTGTEKDNIGDYDVTDPAYCAGNIASIIAQAILLGGLAKGAKGVKIPEELPSTKPALPIPKGEEIPTKTPPTKPSKPNLDNLEEKPQSPKGEIPCVSKVNETQTNVLLAFLGGVSVEAACSVPAKAKTIDLNHIETKHKFGVIDEATGKLTNGNKFLDNADIEALVNEGLANSKRVVTTTTSDVLINGVEKTIPSYQIDVDMGRQVGTNPNQTQPRSNLRIIIDTNGNVISAYPR